MDQDDQIKYLKKLEHVTDLQEQAIAALRLALEALERSRAMEGEQEKLTWGGINVGTSSDPYPPPFSPSYKYPSQKFGYYKNYQFFNSPNLTEISQSGQNTGESPAYPLDQIYTALQKEAMDEPGAFYSVDPATGALSKVQ